MKIARQNYRVLSKINNKRKAPPTQIESKCLDEIKDPLARALFAQLPPPTNGGISFSNVGHDETKIVTQSLVELTSLPT